MEEDDEGGAGGVEEVVVEDEVEVALPIVFMALRYPSIRIRVICISHRYRSTYTNF